MREELQKEVVESITKHNGHCLVNLAPRVGKTKIAIDYLKGAKHNKILWVAPSSEIRDIDVPGEFKKWKASTLLKKVKIIHWSSLNKENCAEYDVIILDEYQMLTLSNSSTLCGRIIGLSGTHPVEKDKLDILKSLGLKICYSLPIDKAVEMGIISPYKINIIEYNLDNTTKNVLSGSKDKPFYTTELQNYTYQTQRINRIKYSGKEVPAYMYMQRQRSLHGYKSRLDIARNIINTLKDRTLIFTHEISHSELLCPYTYNSKTDNTNYDLFQKEKINQLALVNMASVGTTFRNMSNCIIVGTNSKAKNFEQKFCRVLIPREDYVAQIYIICALNTQDETWVTTAISNLDPKNINFINYKNYGHI